MTHKTVPKIGASGAAEYPHRALSDPDGNLSAHRAPSIQRLGNSSGQCAKSPGLVLMKRASHSRASRLLLEALELAAHSDGSRYGADCGAAPPYRSDCSS